MIREIANEHPPVLRRPRFSCDDDICKHNVSPLPNKSFFLVVVGPAGSGKTSTASSLLTSRQVYRGAFERVIVVMPPNSLASLQEDHPFRSLHASNVYPDLDDIDVIYQMIQQTAMTKNERYGNMERSMLFIDDQSASLKDNHIRKRLVQLINNRRHLRCSIILITQYLNSIPLPVRRNISHLIAYRPNNRQETNILFQELLPINREMVGRLLRFVYDQKYNFLFLDVNDGTLFKNFNRLLLPDAEGDAT
jgi:hypothetical protein